MCVPFLLLASASAYAEPTPAELQSQAETAFHQGLQSASRAPDEARKHFAQAAQCYEQLRQAGSANAALYRNQGNAYLLADDLPHAVLAYRRGLQLVPNDHALRRNLAFAREEVRLPPPGSLGRPPVDHRPPWLPRLPAWTPFVALAFYSLGWLTATRWWMLWRGTWLAASAATFALALLLGASLAFEAWQDSREERWPLAVITEDGVLMRRGNGLTYEPRTTTPINRGVEARVLFQRGDWVQIELSGGEVGWVPGAFVLVDK